MRVEPRSGGDVQARAAGRFRRAAEAELRCSALARAATVARASAGSSTTVSPASASTSERSHSSVLNGSSESAALSVSEACAALDLPARDDRRVPEPGEARLAAGSSGRTRRGARTARRSAAPSASGRAGRCAGRPPSGPTCARARRAARARTSTARPTRVVGVSSPSLRYSISTTRRFSTASESVRTSCSSSSPAVPAGVWANSNWPKVSSSLRRTRSSGVRASAAIVGPTYSIASRIARASSGVSFGGLPEDVAVQLLVDPHDARVPRRPPRRPCSSRRRS